MRIIHTADWHLGDRLGRVDRTDDLKARVEVVAGLCESQQADVLLIAGDVFSEQAQIEHMTLALTHLHQTFSTFFARGGTILAVTGNHDRENRVELIRHGMRLAAPLHTRGHRQFQPGRMYLLNRPYFGTLATRAGERAQFVLVPYPTASRYAAPGDVFRTQDEQNRMLQSRVAQEIQTAAEHEEFDRSLPTILAAHLHVSGAEVHTLYKITERDDVVFDTRLLPASWAYIALGHIHKPQCLGGMCHVRYPGSLDRLDFGERADEKGVVVFDLDATGLRGEPRWLPIPATPMLDISLTDPASELPLLAERYPDRATAIVRVRATHIPSATAQDGSVPPTLARDEITRELRRLFPRLIDNITWEKPESPADEARRRRFDPHADARNTIREYLTRQLADDPDKQAILALAEQFLVE